MQTTLNRHILFLAMSGVRIYDKDLLQLGLTLPGFVERSRVIASLPSLGLLTLAAHTPEAWRVCYRECDELPGNTAQAIAEEGFGLVAISALTARIEEAYRLSQQLRDLGLKVIIGGLHVSALPEEAALYADVVIQGEGERVWPQVLEDLDQGHSKPFYSSFGAIGKEAAHKIPRYDLLDLDRYNRLTLQTVRGCPLHCSFCAASRTISPYRKKSLADIERELETILRLWPKPFLELADDNTFVDKVWGKQLASLLGHYPLRWFTETDISLADDTELLKLLARSGCAQVLIGLESASEQAMRGLDTANWKYRKHQSYRERIQKIQEYGISVNGCFILGFDQDDATTFPRTLDFIDSLGMAEVQITLLTPFPGTDFRKNLLADKRLTAATEWSKYTLFDTTFTPARMTEDALRKQFHWLMEHVYTDDRIAQRKSIMKTCIQAARKTREAL